MKCEIVTVYNSENCGSFLQAFALSQALKKLKHETMFIRQNFSDHSASVRNYIKSIIKAVLKGRFSDAKRIAKKRVAFHNAFSNIKVIDGLELPACCVLGSDVIWDVTSSFFKNHHRFFWGTQFNGAKVISYAASVGFAKKEDLENCKFIHEALEKMASVSVRDKISKSLLQPYCDKEIQTVCDPTYLIEKEEYDKIASQTALSDFIFLYYYGEMPPEDKEWLQMLAKEEKLKIVTFGNYNTWCDINLAYDPLLFLSLYNKANYIITNTFHGTVFATIYEKRFAVIKNDKPKILDVLDMCAMSDKMTKSPKDLAIILHSEFKYDVTRQNIMKEREKGLQYLQMATKE